jgi:galactokinase
MIKVSAPARICFFGDHQDYLNLPVIAGTINRFIQIEAEPSKENLFLIQLIDIQKVKTIHLNKKYNKIDNGDYFLSVLEVLIKALIKVIRLKYPETYLLMQVYQALQH